MLQCTCSIGNDDCPCGQRYESYDGRIGPDRGNLGTKLVFVCLFVLLVQWDTTRIESSVGDRLKSKMIPNRSNRTSKIKLVQ